jgi:hypothetical protein
MYAANAEFCLPLIIEKSKFEKANSPTFSVANISRFTTWSALKSDLTYFRFPAPDGSAIASRDAYFQITDADSFITCVQMATRAPSCINYSWLVRVKMKHPLSLRKRGVPRSKPQLGHHCIPKPADVSLLGTRLKVLHFIHDTNREKTGK